MRTAAVRLFVCFSLLLTTFQAGCATMTMDEKEHARSQRFSTDADPKMMAEDVDTLMMLDRPSRLTKWHTK